MLTLYRPGNGMLHRTGAGVKLAVALITVLAVSLLPLTPAATLIAIGAAVLAYAIAGFGDGAAGMRVLGSQVWALRYGIALMALGQLILMGPWPAVANTIRVSAAILLAGLVALTTTVTDMLDAIERALTPLRLIRLDPARIALALTITLSTLPVLARLAHAVREAQRARGVRIGIRSFTAPYLVIALKHADRLGEALAARGAA